MRETDTERQRERESDRERERERERETDRQTSRQTDRRTDKSDEHYESMYIFIFRLYGIYSVFLWPCCYFSPSVWKHINSHCIIAITVSVIFEVG